MRPPLALPRHALYYAPELDDPLWAAGCAWLGRDPRHAPAVDAALPHAHTAAPALYGFHATLKPPFGLAADATETDLLAAVVALGARHAPFDMPRMQVAWLGRFLAVLPAHTLDAHHPLQGLADACVRELDAFRREAAPEDLARRRAVGLDAEQDALLERWGYPHVLSRWRFHMTLSDSLPDISASHAQDLAHAALALFEPALAVPRVCRSVCVYRQAASGEAFRLTHRIALNAPSARAAQPGKDAAPR